MFDAVERQELYLLAAALFRYPTTDTLGVLKNVQQEAVAEVFTDLPTFPVAELDDPEALQAQFTWLFLNRPGGITSPLYGSTYLEPDNQVMGLTTKRVESVYRMAGVTMEDDGEPADSLPTELAFLAWLCEREAEASEADDTGKARHFRDKQSAFFQQECGVWGVDFCNKLLDAEPSPLYAWAGLFLKAFLTQEKETLRSA